MHIPTACMWAGYYSNYFARSLGRDCERITRPFKPGEEGFAKTACAEVTERVTRAVKAAACVVPAVVGCVFCVVFLGLSVLLGKERLEYYEDRSVLPPVAEGRQITVLSVNGCMQEGCFAPITGGVVPPFDPVGRYPTRIAGLAHRTGIRKIDVLIGQEFHDLSAQDAFVAEKKKYGFRYFLIDRGPHPVYMNSGTIVASRIPIKRARFVPYPWEDRAGLAKGTLQGAIQFTVEKNGRMLTLFNTHLNYGDENQAARNRQLKNHVMPLFRSETHPALIGGDLNFDTSVDGVKRAAGIEGLVNAAEGQVTCTSEGELHLRGRKGPAVLERIDAILASPDLPFSQLSVEPLKEGDLLLSDHYTVQATV
jgi:endonuclease/exonuclease/phosphatase family metal-dependent hydrolase